MHTLFHAHSIKGLSAVQFIFSLISVPIEMRISVIKLVFFHVSYNIPVIIETKISIPENETLT